MKLISMTSFVLEQKRPIPSADLHEADYYQQEYEVLDKVCNYANFLNQPLTLGMFVPTDEDGNVLEEPEFHEPNNENEIGDYDELRYQYQQAKDKVLFDGFEVCNRQDELICIVLNEDEHVSIKWLENKTIENIVKYNLTLTPNAIK